jgi:septal ring factor EnvC (AmiA/AmiB activator)
LDKNNKTSEQTEQTMISSSLRFALLASALTTIGDAIAIISVLEAIDESIAEDIQAKKDQQELDDKLEKMQKQIDRLTYELAQIKKGRRDSGFRQ